MASLEWRVINELIRSKDMNSVCKIGFNSDHLAGEPEAAQIFDFIRQWYHSNQTHGQFPTMATIKRRWPSFLKTGDYDKGNLRTLLAECKAAAVASDLRSLSSYFQELVENQSDDPELIIKTMQSQLSKTLYSAQHTSGFSVREIADSVKAQYESAGAGTIYGIPWVWDSLTQDTLGKHKEDFIVIYGRMKSMKCIAAGERIMMSNGALVPIEHVPEETTVPSYTERTGHIRRADAKRVCSGIKPCVEVETESGLRLRSGDEHLYMVPGHGYKRISHLKPGDYIATARRLPGWTSSSNLSPEDGHMLGLLVGSGSYDSNAVQFKNEDPEILVRLAVHVARWNCEIHTTKSPIEHRIIRNRSDPDGEFNNILDLLKQLKIHGQKDTLKRAPEELFTASKQTIAAFIGGLIDANGCISSTLLSVSSVSRDLLADVQALLMRFGVRGYVKEALAKTYQLYVYSKELNLILNEEIGPYLCLSRKQNSLTSLAKAFDSKKIEKATNDIIWEQIISIRDIGNLPCYDICITDGQDPNFVIEGFIVHNTWILLVNAVTDYVVNKRRVLIWSREMNQQKMALRAGSILANVDYQMLKNGTLPFPLYDKAMSGLGAMVHAMERTKAGLLRLEKEHDYEENGGSDLFIVCGRNAPRSLEAFDAVVRAFNPDIVYLDSMYHMDCASMLKMKSDHERQRELAVQIKQRAVDWGIPVLATTQANREGDKTHGETMIDVGRTDALAQEADLILRVLHRMGPEPSENDYEGYWDQLKNNNSPQEQKHAVKRNGRMQLSINRVAAAMFSRSDGVPQKVTAKFDRLPKEPRKAAELFLMVGGNREGVLEGISFRCIPGYTWGPERIVTKKEVKEIFSDKGEQASHGGGHKKLKKGSREFKPLDPTEVGASFKAE